jgi:hypothetical protein
LEGLGSRGSERVRTPLLGAHKAARWLGIPPTLDPDALAAFLARHTADYLALRSKLATGPQGSA